MVARGINEYFIQIWSHVSYLCMLSILHLHWPFIYCCQLLYGCLKSSSIVHGASCSCQCLQIITKIMNIFSYFSYLFQFNLIASSVGVTRSQIYSFNFIWLLYLAQIGHSILLGGYSGINFFFNDNIVMMTGELRRMRVNEAFYGPIKDTFYSLYSIYKKTTTNIIYIFRNLNYVYTL